MNDAQKVLNGKFDIDTHKMTFVNYLEVIILEDGEVVYAVPSHQEKLIAIAMKKLGVTRRQLYDMCPPEYMFDVTGWLCEITNCVSVWNDFHIGKTNHIQEWALRTLKMHELYKGEIEQEVNQ